MIISPRFRRASCGLSIRASLPLLTELAALLNNVANCSLNCSMDTSNLDRLPVSQLTTRYNIGRTSLYKRLSDLNLKPHTLGNKAYVDAVQIDLLDRLDQHLKSGHQTAEFLEVVQLFTEQFNEQTAAQFSKQSDLDISNPLFALSNDSTFLSILSDLAAGLSRSPTADISARLHLLQDACNYGWLLPTSELAQVLVISPKTLTHHKSYQRYGFTFTKVGHRGIESAWEVTKS